MKERPILFSGEMVRAILDGRKTQTRRAFYYPFPSDEFIGMDEFFGCAHAMFEHGDVCCPYGQVGDRLWVREAWRTSSIYDHLSPCKIPTDASLQFEADTSAIKYLGEHPGKIRPSIFMPRWASRITLEIVNVQAERVQNISNDDAKAEGVIPEWDDFDHNSLHADYDGEQAYRMAFERLWDSINAKRGVGWDANPHVWVIEFKAVQP